MKKNIGRRTIFRIGHPVSHGNGDAVSYNISGEFNKMKLELLQITEKKEAQFSRAGIYTVEDLLETWPKKYIDAREPVRIDDAEDGDACRVEGELIYIRKAPKCSYFILSERTSLRHLKVLFFHADYRLDSLHRGDRISVVGKFSLESYGGTESLVISNPKYMCVNSSSLSRIIPVYRKITGMSEEYYETCVGKALEEIKAEDYLSGDILIGQDLCTLQSAYQKLHKPSCPEDIGDAKKRLVFDRLFLFNLMLAEKKLKNGNKTSPYVFTGCTLMKRYYQSMKFDLTDGQKEVVRSLYRHGRNGERISTLLQADVGYGKTECAKMLSLFGVESGCQVAVIAPTAVLARQHFRDFSEAFEELGVSVGLLAGDVGQRERKKVLQRLERGELDILIGTHACLSDSVAFKRLGVVIVDEEHKFGVKQREKLIEKTRNGVHYLSMSATPIPRTLALAVYGDDVEVQTIKTPPAFKKEVITTAVKKDSDVHAPLLEQLKLGHQAYIICPAIGDEDDAEGTALALNRDVGKKYEQFLRPYGYRVGTLDGKMKKNEMNSVIDAFVKNEIQALVSTTVVEVGVNVPNATMIIIKNAERFGLAQMHQLRGRVGRGNAQGFCILESADEKAQERIRVLVDSSDGFYIAEKDLEARGAGNLAGTAQKGRNEYIDLIARHPDFNMKIRDLVQRLYKDDAIREYFEDYFEASLKKMQEQEN